MVASHHTGMITAQFSASCLLLGFAVVVFAVAMAKERFVVFASVAALAVAGAGGYLLAEVPALHHNHLCHAHHHDMCNNDNAARDEHTHGDHWFGGRAAK